ncbi:family 20 glycosylhydrolase [Phenylobacterium sp.]|uniref:family 20 glycosylhydrolase n=1 Tax=Phenylobacterium sp. TaxID=1871053 RepID=UPI002FC66B49
MIRSLFLAALLIAAPAAAAERVSMIPAPASEAPMAGSFHLTSRTVISVEAGDPRARASAQFLADLLQRTRGLNLAVGTPKSGEPAIRLAGGQGAGEGYKVAVSPDGIAVTGSGEAGLFYGAVTVWQLATQTPGRGPVEIPAVTLDDAPRFAWRGLMLDSARHFQSVDFIKGLIDQMALVKLNTLQWHLTDDQAWRLEIRKYPRLTEVGAWRVPAGPAAAADIDPKTGKPRAIGGFYTQAQVRELVAYAAARHVTIVPEIEMPGHALAPILAYPHLGSAPVPTDNISGDWGVFPYLYNVEEPTFGFLEDVLAEVTELFPSRYIHVGGDEAVKDQWRSSPAVQARMKALHIGSEAQLQGWFISRIEQVLNARGRRLIGWDEILEGGVAKGATITSWRGIDGAIIAAKLGHDAVLSPAPTLYLDNRQSAAPDEPPGRGQVVSLKTVYDFDPMPAALDDDERPHILGVQANLWTEHVRTEQRAAMMLFPRAAALAEIAWAPAARRDWNGFADRLPAQLARYRALGQTYDETPLEVRGLGDPAGDGARLALLGAEGLGEIRYTLDGSAPTPASPIYAAPLEVKLGATVRAQAYRAGQALAPASAIKVDARAIRTRRSQELKSCSENILLNLEDDAPVRGERARFFIDVLAPCWTYEGADLSGVSRIEVAVGQLPFNFQIGKDIEKIVFRPPATPQGELEVRQGSCQGPVVAVLPLALAAKSQGVTVLTSEIKGEAGPRDLCFTFTQKTVAPMWALDRVTLVAEAPRGR